jgi:hypothetical protein
VKQPARKKPTLPAAWEKSSPGADRLLNDLRNLIETGRARIVQVVNAGMVLL